MFNPSLIKEIMEIFSQLADITSPKARSENMRQRFKEGDNIKEYINLYMSIFEPHEKKER